MSVNAVFLCIPEDAGQERIADFVIFSCFSNLLGYGVLVLGEKVFREGRQSGLGAPVGNVQLVKDLCNGGRSPKLNTQACFLLDLHELAFDNLQKVLLEAFGGVEINADTVPCHFYTKG